MMQFDFIRHCDLNEKQMLEIGYLKKQHWDYPIDMQIEWIRKNISNEDIHLILKKDEVIVGYLTLIPIEIDIDDDKETMIGIGSVCIDKNFQGQNLGFLIMQIAGYYLMKNSVVGVLLCKKELVNFYSKCNWNSFNGELLLQSMPLEHILFFSKPIIASKVNLSKIF